VIRLEGVLVIETATLDDLNEVCYFAGCKRLHNPAAPFCFIGVPQEETPMTRSTTPGRFNPNRRETLSRGAVNGAAGDCFFPAKFAANKRKSPVKRRGRLRSTAVERVGAKRFLRPALSGIDSGAAARVVGDETDECKIHGIVCAEELQS
jgi:hypothetical protein